MLSPQEKKEERCSPTDVVSTCLQRRILFSQSDLDTGDVAGSSFFIGDCFCSDADILYLCVRDEPVAGDLGCVNSATYGSATCFDDDFRGATVELCDDC